MTSQAEQAHVVATIQRAMNAAIIARDVAARYGLEEGCERIKWALDFLHVALEKVRESA